MSVPRPRAKKPTAVDEVVRTLGVLDMLTEQVQQRANPPARVIYTRERIALLAVAERIAARTED